MLDEVLLPGRFRRGIAQQPADGFLCARADRARCARAWRRGASGRCEFVGLGLHAGKRSTPSPEKGGGPPPPPPPAPPPPFWGGEEKAPPPPPLPPAPHSHH